MTGLVTKGRRQQQIANAPRFQKAREEIRQSRFGATSKRTCKCGNYTSGLYKEGKLICPMCKQIL